jgi:hypothetical protein
MRVLIFSLNNVVLWSCHIYTCQVIYGRKGAFPPPIN